MITIIVIAAVSFVLGVVFGVFLMALCQAAKNTERELEEDSNGQL